MTPATPLPFEIPLDSDLVLRGLEYQQDGPPVVLVHDIGGDADSWRGIPLELTAKGFRVMNLELRGHGLSDGEADPERTEADLKEALSAIDGSFGPVGLVGLGTVATTMFTLGPDDGAPVHALVSPRSSELFDSGRGVAAMRAIFAGSGDDEADGFIRSIYQRLPGQNMWFSTGVDARGTDLLEANPTMIEQIAMFLRRYLTAHHLAWISDRRLETGNDPSGDIEDGQSKRAASE